MKTTLQEKFTCTIQPAETKNENKNYFAGGNCCSEQNLPLSVHIQMVAPVECCTTLSVLLISETFHFGCCFQINQTAVSDYAWKDAPKLWFSYIKGLLFSIVHDTFVAEIGMMEEKLLAQNLPLMTKLSAKYQNLLPLLPGGKILWHNFSFYDR